MFKVIVAALLITGVSTAVWAKGGGKGKPPKNWGQYKKQFTDDYRPAPPGWSRGNAWWKRDYQYAPLPSTSYYRGDYYAPVPRGYEVWRYEQPEMLPAPPAQQYDPDGEYWEF